MPRVIDDDNLKKLDNVGLVRNKSGERVFQTDKVKEPTVSNAEIDKIKLTQSKILSELYRVQFLAKYAIDQVEDIKSNSNKSWSFSIERSNDGYINSVNAGSGNGTWQISISRDSENSIDGMKAIKV